MEEEVGLLLSARSGVAVAAVNDKAIIVIGGYSEGDTKTNRNLQIIQSESDRTVTSRTNLLKAI